MESLWRGRNKSRPRFFRGEIVYSMLQLARVSLAFLCNFASGPATVMSNKMVFVTTGFSFPILLTVCHYVCTWLVIKAMSRLGVYSPAQAQLLSSKGSGARRSVILLIITWSFYNIMSNLSLSQNSVGIYQMIKLLMAPAQSSGISCSTGRSRRLGKACFYVWPFLEFTPALSQAWTAGTSPFLVWRWPSWQCSWPFSRRA